MSETSKKYEIKEAKTEIEILNCYPVLKILRSHLKYVDDYVARVQRQQSKGYRLLYVADSDKVLAVLGFTIRERLLSSQTVFLEDFCALNWSFHEEIGPILLGWLISYAKDNHCDNIVTDSSFTRHEAHRFYLNHGFRLTAHHFAQSLVAKKIPAAAALASDSTPLQLHPPDN